MRYEKIKKLLNKVDLSIDKMECKREGGSWKFSCGIYIEGGCVHYIIPKEENEYGFNICGHLCATGNNPNDIVNKLFDDAKSNLLIVRYYNTGKYTIKWDEESKEFIKSECLKSVEEAEADAAAFNKFKAILIKNKYNEKIHQRRSHQGC